MAMDSGGFGGFQPPPSGGSGFRPIGNGYGIQPLGATPLGGDLHETFRVSKIGELLDDHVTVRLPGGRSIRLP